MTPNPALDSDGQLVSLGGIPRNATTAWNRSEAEPVRGGIRWTSAMERANLATSRCRRYQHRRATVD
jgi:hypothetical protein